MKSITSIDKFKEGESIQGFYLCFEKHIRHNRNGDLYIDLRLRDKSGSINAKIWDNVNGLRDATAQETTEIDAKEKAYSDGELNRELEILRIKRNRLLTETDFYALSDVTMSSDMTTYRQNLRDLTNGLDTVDKVKNVTWPTKP